MVLTTAENEMWEAGCQQQQRRDVRSRITATAETRCKQQDNSNSRDEM
jgi:hypothetical protein